MVPRCETWLLGVGSLLWLGVGLAYRGVVPLSNTWDLDLYRLFSFSGALGWLVGNIYVFRRQRLGQRLGERLEEGLPAPSAERRARRLTFSLLSVYLLSPPSLLFLLRVMAPPAVQAAAPLVPIYSLCIYGLFFLVPVTLKVGRTPLHR